MLNIESEKRQGRGHRLSREDKEECVRRVVIDYERCVDVAKEVGVNYGTLNNWIKQLRDEVQEKNRA